MHECLKKRKIFSLERLDNILGGELFIPTFHTGEKRMSPPPTGGN